MKQYLLICLSLLLLLCGCRQQDANREEQAPAVIVEIGAATAAPTAEPTSVPTDTPAPSDTPAPTGTPAPTDAPERYAAPEGVETVAWLSDTQHYANFAAKDLPNIYPVMTGFLRDKAQQMHLAYIVHTGDLVHVNSDPENWRVAREAMDMLSGIPTGVLAGNHDMDVKKQDLTNYCTNFGQKFFEDQACYGESFQDNRGHYDLITLCGRDYIFVYMSFAPDKKAIQFIKASFDKYPDRVGILCLHDFITTEGTLSEAGEELREQVVAKCPNVYMVLCGHRYGLYTLEDAFDDDGDGVKERTVYEIMMNYQAAGKEGGGGYLRLMQFDEENKEIRCINYSPYLDDYDWLDDPAHNEKRYEMDEKSESFTLKMPWA